MRNFPSNLRPLTLCAATLALTASARAAILSQDSAPQLGPPQFTDWSSSISFPQFNPALGTLQSVEFSLSGAFTGTVPVYSGSPTGGSGTACTTILMTVQDAANNFPAPALNLASSSPFNVPTYGGTGVSVSAGDIFDQTFTCDSILSEFTGTGSASLAASTSTQTSVNVTDGNISYNPGTASSMAWLTGTVTYTFTPVPEPTTCWLLAAALPLLRRKKGLRDSL